MTARQIIVPGAMPSRDRNGRALAAKLRFYSPGTTTPKSVYTDNTLTTAHPFPLLSDSAGRFPPIWGDDAQTYDVAWSDQTFDAAQATYANVTPSQEAVTTSDLATATGAAATSATAAASSATSAAGSASTATTQATNAANSATSAASSASAASTSATAASTSATNASTSAGAAAGSATSAAGSATAAATSATAAAASATAAAGSATAAANSQSSAATSASGAAALVATALTGGQDLGTRAGWAAVSIPATIKSLRTSGYSNAGDGGQGLYMRVDGQPTYPGSWFRSQDRFKVNGAVDNTLGGYWLYVPDQRGVNAKAFGATGTAAEDGSRNFSGTDDWQALQNAIDFAIFSAKCRVYIPAGRYRITDTLQLGYTGLNSCVLEGDGAPYAGESGFSGTGIYCDFYDRPGIAVNAARATRIRGLSLMGRNFHYLESNGHMGPAPSVDDTVLTNWIDPTLLSGNPNINAQYTPYAAIAVDGYAGSQPATHYPNRTFPSWSGISSQYGASPSSNVMIEDCFIGGFVVVLAIQPANINANGDFIKLRDVRAANNVIIISAGNNQGREVATLDCSFSLFHTGIVNGVHGQQQGQIQLSSDSTDWEDCIQIFDMASATVAGASAIRNCYSESIWRLGKWGGNAADCSPLTFSTCEFTFTAINDRRGHPLSILDAGSPGAVKFDSCMFINFGKVAYFTGSPELFTFENCTVNRGYTPANLYEKFASNFLGSGFMFQVSTSPTKPSVFNMKSSFVYNLVTGGATGRAYFKDLTLSDRKTCCCAWLREAAPSQQAHARRRVPSFWFPTSKTDARITAASLTGSTLSLTFNTASWTPAVAAIGGLPGDVMWDDQTGSVFFIRSYDPATGILLAELQNNYKVVGGTFDGNGNTTGGGTVTPSTSISTSVGNWYFGNARVMLNQYFTRGDSSTASAVISNAGRDDGFGGYLTTDLAAGDYAFIDETIDRWFAASNAKITAVSSSSITLNGNAAIAYTKHDVGFFIQQPPANV